MSTAEEGKLMKNVPESLLRVTVQRQIILDELRKSNHPTACELYDMVRRHLPRIGLGTVYRNLDTMADLGLILKLEVGGSQKRFDAMIEPHYHIRCARCNRVENINVDVIQDIAQAAAEKTSYRILGHHVEFTGLCPKCQAANPDLIPPNVSEDKFCSP
jgi:Fur family ferric uptake transcriptional regulator